MTDTMTLPDKLRSAARSPDNWDLPGLLADAADSLEIAANLMLEAANAIDPEDDDDDGPECTDPLDVASVALPTDRHPCQCNRHTTDRREVVPGWTLEELLSREG